MILDLSDVKRIAQEVARAADRSLDVIGAVATTAGSPYTELMMVIRGCHQEPSRFVIGADRGSGEQALRVAIASRLRQHLNQSLD